MGKFLLLKRSVLFYTCLSFCNLASALPFSRGVVTTREGNESSGGGQFISIEFKQRARDLFNELKIKKGVLKIGELSTDDFLSILEATTVVGRNGKLFLDGEEVTALNTPSKKLIEVNQALWDRYQGNQKIIDGLILHEMISLVEGYYGILDESKNYLYSSNLIEILYGNYKNMMFRHSLYSPGTILINKSKNNKTSENIINYSICIEMNRLEQYQITMAPEFLFSLKNKKLKISRDRFVYHPLINEYQDNKVTKCHPFEIAYTQDDYNPGEEIEMTISFGMYQRDFILP